MNIRTFEEDTLFSIFIDNDFERNKTVPFLLPKGEYVKLIYEINRGSIDQYSHTPKTRIKSPVLVLENIHQPSVRRKKSDFKVVTSRDSNMKIYVLAKTSITLYFLKPKNKLDIC
jgi:hypothetical protein